jgi:hypothetical protein
LNLRASGDITRKTLFSSTCVLQKQIVINPQYYRRRTDEVIRLKYEIKYKPSYAMLVVTLDQGESITAEAGSMTYMDPSIEPHTRKREKSFWGTVGLSLIGGQSFFVNDYLPKDLTPKLALLLLQLAI